VSPTRLPACPATLEDTGGAPRFGTYEGGLDTVDLSRLRGAFQPNRLGRAAMHKKWQYAFVATPEVAALMAVVDVGYASNAFVLAIDLKSGALLCDETVLGPPRPLVRVSDHPGAGLAVKLHQGLRRFDVRRDPGDERFHLAVKVGVALPLKPAALNLKVDLLAADAAPPLTVIAPVDGGIVNITQKWAGLLAFGELTAGHRRYRLDGGIGGLDYTHGYLARHAAWRWAFACGRLEDGTPLGLNLVEGFNESRADVNENALWVGNRLVPLGRARFTWNRREVLDRWHVTTTDGAVDLTFTPLAVHREERNLVLVKSHFLQPVGTWEGTVRVDGVTHHVAHLPGVAEDQDVLW
jgi:hypothetical protein